MRHVLLLGILLLAGCSATSTTGPAKPVEKGSTIQQEGGTPPALQALVENYIRKKANDPSSVVIDSWGPHDLTGATFVVRHKGDAILRVCWREKNTHGALQRYDKLFTIWHGDHVLAATDNRLEEGWFNWHKAQHEEDMAGQKK